MDSPLEALAPYLWEGYTRVWSRSRGQLLESLASGHRVGGRGEEAVTEALCAVVGEPGSCLARILLRAAGIQPRPRAEMVRPGDKSLIHLRGRRSPDLFIADLDTSEVLLAIEGKGQADVNGGWGYCPWYLDTYSNQAICYPHGCWVSESVDPATGYLWLHPLAHDPRKTGILATWQTDPFYTHGDEVRARQLAEAYALQQEAWERSWSTFSWEQLCRELLVAAVPRGTAPAGVGVVFE